MKSSNNTRNAKSLMHAAKHTLALYALIVIVVEAELVTAATLAGGLDRTIIISGMVGILALVVIIAGWRYTNPSRDALSNEIFSLWDAEDIPLPQELERSWIGKWNCRWSYRTPTGELKPYADDNIHIDSVDIKTGKITGTGVRL